MRPIWRWAIQTGADIIAMSFVRFATDIDRAHEIMDEKDAAFRSSPRSKSRRLLRNLEEIVKAFDGIMVARGDMAVECPLEEVLATKRCIELARQYAAGHRGHRGPRLHGQLPGPDPCRGLTAPTPF